MSTVAVLNLSSSGHINPSLPLVAELVRRGEYVIYYAIEPYRTIIENSGAEYRSYNHPESIKPKIHQGGLFSNMAHYIKAAEANLPALLEQFEANPPDYLLLDSMCIWGNLIQQILKIPAISFSSIFIMHPNLPSEMIIEMVYQNLPKEVIIKGLKSLYAYFEDAQRFDHQYGTQSPNLVQAFSNAQGLNLLFTSNKFHPFIEMYDQQIYKFIGPSITERAETVAFPFEQLGADPIIYISLGTINNEEPEFFKACYAAFADSSYQVVMSIGNKVAQTELGPPPDNFIVRPYVPQLKILQQVSAFITHGGMNSACEALLYGVPLLVIPRRGDQFLVAGEVAKSGVGLILSATEITPQTLQNAVGKVLAEPNFTQHAQALGQSFKDAGGYVRGADEIFAYKQKLGLST